MKFYVLLVLCLIQLSVSDKRKRNSHSHKVKSTTKTSSTNKKDFIADDPCVHHVFSVPTLNMVHLAAPVCVAPLVRPIIDCAP